MPSSILRDFGNGLVMRRGTRGDADALAAFCGHVHGDETFGNPNLRISAWTRDLASRPHPTMGPEDFTIVEESSSGRIVSTSCLIPQAWTYEGIEFGVGRTELVGTLPEFRRRGLVRAQMEQIHEWSTQRGHLVQAITGIAHYYRRFGYEMALDLGGRRFGHESNVPQLPDGSEEAFRIRPAQESDIPLIAELYALTCARAAVACKRTPEIWRYELQGQSEESDCRFVIRIIEDLQRRPVGYLRHREFLGLTGLSLGSYELVPGVSWLQVTPTVVRYLWKHGGELALTEGRPRTTFGFVLGTQHPVYEALGRDLPTIVEPYAWYLRVPDLVGFLQHIRPALERRLAASIAAGHTGTLNISFYASGIHLALDRGALRVIEPWAPEPRFESGDVRFPDLTFLQVLFGRRTLQELRLAFPDCGWKDNESLVLINALFPRQSPEILPIA
jgi:GNAT superfamily N-acetyltransferase